MPVTKADIMRELAKRELAKRQSGVIDKAVDAVKSFDEYQSEKASTGVNLNLVGRMGLNPITDKSATMTGTEAERFALNLISDPLRMGIGLIDQAVANPYEAVAGLVKAPIHILGNLYKGVFGTDEQKEQALQETINSPLSPVAVAAPVMGIAGRAMTPASLRGVDLAALQRTAAEARMTSPIDLPPPEPVAPLQLTYKPDTPNLGILRKRGEVVDRAMTPEEWQAWLANEEANAPVVRNYLTDNGKRFATVNPKASVIPTDLSAKPSNTGEGFTFRNPRPGETPGLASQIEYKGSTPLQLEYNRGVSETYPTVPKTEPVASVQGGEVIGSLSQNANKHNNSIQVPTQPVQKTPKTIQNQTRKPYTITKQQAELRDAAVADAKAIINNPDIVGKQRTDMIAYRRNLVQFAESPAARDMRLDYRNGTKVAKFDINPFTGVSPERGFEWYIELDGPYAGRIGQDRTILQTASDIARDKKVWAEQQEGFKKIRESGKSDQMPNKPPVASGKGGRQYVHMTTDVGYDGIMKSGELKIGQQRTYGDSELGNAIYLTNEGSFYTDPIKAAESRLPEYTKKLNVTVSNDANIVTINTFDDLNGLARKLGYGNGDKMLRELGIAGGVKSSERASAAVVKRLREQGIDGIEVPNHIKDDNGFTILTGEQTAIYNPKVVKVEKSTPPSPVGEPPVASVQGGGVAQRVKEIRPAIRYNGEVYTGKTGQNHADIWEQLPEGFDPNKATDAGWVTQDGTWLNRKQAAQYVLEKKNITKEELSQYGHASGMRRAIDTPPSPVGKAKEPWEMTKAEFVQAGPDGYSNSGNYGWSKTGGDHGAAVATAVNDGLPVPPEVLKDYPDLVKGKEGGVEYREAGLRPQVIAENMPEPVKRVFYSAEGRITLPESKAMFADIERSTQTQKANLEGPWMNETHATGLGKLDEAGANQVRAELESGNLGTVPSAPKIFGLVPKGKTQVATERLRAVLEDIWTQAKAAGIEIGKVKNYFPRIIKREIAERINDDLRSVVAELEKSENVSDVAVAKALEKADAKTKQIITHMIETGQAKGYNDAVQNLYHAAQHDLYKVTSFEKHRSQLTELPSWVYEQDARKVIPLYIEAMSKRIADARIFGPNGEKAQPLIDAIKSKDLKEAQLVEEVYRTHAGLQQSLHPMSSVSRQAVNALTGFLYGTKITVKSTIPNLVQTMHSVAKDYGIHRMNQAIVRLATDKTFREQIRKTGVVDLDMMTAMSGYHPGGVWGKFADIATKVQGFKAANRMNQYLSAGTAKVFIEEAYAKARGEKNVWFGNRRHEWFQQELADLGIDYTKPLDDATVARAMYKVASDTQLMHNILKEPVWMNNQRLRVLALFKRFAYRQAKYQVDTLTKEFKRGNVVPALRLAAQGYIAAKFTGWANEQLRKALSGEQVYSDNEGWREFVEALAQIGAVGVFSDIAGGLATQTPTKAVVDKAKFAMTPVVADAAQKGMELGSKVAGDVDKLGAGPAFRKNVDEILQFVSPVLGYVGDRMLTQREQSYRDVYRKANKKNEILDVILMGDAERAKRMIQRWNEANKNNPALVLTGKDINGKAVKSRAENKAKAQAGVR